MTERMDSACCGDKSFLYWNGERMVRPAKTLRALHWRVFSASLQLHDGFCPRLLNYSSQLNSMWLKMPSKGFFHRSPHDLTKRLENMSKHPLRPDKAFPILLHSTVVGLPASMLQFPECPFKVRKQFVFQSTTADNDTVDKRRTNRGAS